MKAFGPAYKTFEGAEKRRAFEMAMNPGEYRRGDVSSLYRYSVIGEPGAYRVAREKVQS